MRRFALFLLLVGCRQLLGFEDPAVIPGDGPAPDTVDAPITCSVASSCPATAPICVDDICVECTETAADLCTATTPVCGSDHTCRACQSHDECPSEVCLASGACAVAAEVAYVDQNGGGIACSQAAPCLTLAQGVTRGLATIKITGTVTNTVTTQITNGSRTIYAARDAVLTRANNGTILEIDGPANVTIYDLIVRDAQSSTGIGIRVGGGTVTLERVKVLANAGQGLDVRNSSTATLRRCIVSGNLSGGGEFENSTFDITNTLFVNNGTASSGLGGVRLKAQPGSNSVFELNTVANNASVNTSQSGVRCDDVVTAHSNIVTGNTLDTQCTFTHSLFDNLPAGTGNVMGAPQFIATNVNDPLSADYFRIGADSDAIDAAISTLTTDIDGALRPTGDAPDMGADERP